MRKICFLEEIKQRYLMIQKFEKVSMALNCTEQLLILVSAITGCVSISTFALNAKGIQALYVPIGIVSSVVGFKICAITQGIKKYTSIIQKKRKKIVIKQSCYPRLSTEKVAIPQAFINSGISHDEFF